MDTNIPTFSSLKRKEYLQQLQSETFDLLVIGGGVTGCGIALDAASRGLKVALIEKSDFASGTSSKSTKLIHGGLRYLKQLDFGLVRETGTERAVVHRLAPHLVLPEKMLMPLIKGGTYGKLATSFGLWVYDILAGVEGDDRRKMLSKKKTLQLEPLLNPDGLKGSGYYAEYRTDDARLTIELIKTASRYGAVALNYCSAQDFMYKNEIVNGVLCKDEIEQQNFSVEAKKIVVAGGPWVDLVRKRDSKISGKRLHLTKGVHLVFPHEKFPLRHTTYFDAPDGRMIFAIPRGKITYVGTTDTTYRGSLDRVVVTQADAEYLIGTIRHAFPTIKLQSKDILSSWAGLRPLIHEDGKSPSELSRKDEIFISKNGLISIAGGKLTGYRKMAQRIVNLVTKDLQKKENNVFTKCKTRKIPLTETPFSNFKNVKLFIEKRTTSFREYDLTAYHAWYLTTTYGKPSDFIFEKFKTLREKFPSENAEILLARAEVWFTVHHEMVERAEDFFVRRTGRLYFDIERISKIRSAVMKDLEKYLGWTTERLLEENQRLDELIFDATNFYKREIVKI